MITVRDLVIALLSANLSDKHSVRKTVDVSNCLAAANWRGAGTAKKGVH
jgi:hypothetical protein